MNKLLVRAMFAFLVLPGVVAFLVPFLLLAPGEPGLHFDVLGTIPLGLGLGLLLWCVREFYVVGKGTLAPWAPPQELVVTGPYRVSRNPMYIAVVLVVWGWAACFRSSSIAVYALAITLAFHLRVVLGEEPWLARTHGEKWAQYKDQVPRWVGAPPASLVARWTRATFLGWSLGFLLLLMFISVSGMLGLGDTQFPLGLGMGTGVGALQRWVVAERVGAATAWWRATILGVTAPFVAWDLVKLLRIQLPYALAGAVVLGGLTVGVLQARVLRAHSPRSAAWIPASLLGGSLAAATVVVNDHVLPKIPGLTGALIYVAVILAGGLLLGATTGLALERIVKAPALDGRAEP
jgi:protein-S-isoprenylcysteine O-methyltransferase Ste14